MENLIQELYALIKDYHSDESNPLQFNDIETWIKQFELEDQLFILSELIHLLNKGIYISKEKAKELLWSNFIQLSKLNGYTDLRKFIWESHFFKLQDEGKSQNILFKILNELVEQNTGVSLNTDLGYTKKNYIYLDDVIGTGKTVLGSLKKWLSENNNSNKVLSGQINLIVSVFCMHEWAVQNIKWSLKCVFENDKFLKVPIFQSNFIIDNRVWLPSANLNCLYPNSFQSTMVMNYLESLEAKNYADKSFRKIGQPKEEHFFSSIENRNRFEKIIIEKGIEILEKVKKKNPSHRPLGSTYPHYKTLGTGTLFFTWRNISNTCPLVFWWDNPAHDWKGLFPLGGRGN